MMVSICSGDKKVGKELFNVFSIFLDSAGNDYFVITLIYPLSVNRIFKGRISPSVSLYR